MTQRCITINQTATDAGSITNYKPRISIRVAECVVLLMLVSKNSAANNVKATLIENGGIA